MENKNRRGVKRIVVYFLLLISCGNNKYFLNENPNIALSWRASKNILNESYVSIYIKNNTKDTAVIFLKTFTDRTDKGFNLSTLDLSYFWIINQKDTLILGDYFASRIFYILPNTERECILGVLNIKSDVSYPQIRSYTEMETNILMNGSLHYNYSCFDKVSPYKAKYIVINPCTIKRDTKDRPKKEESLDLEQKQYTEEEMMKNPHDWDWD